jgi:hypothetical protein
LVVPVAILITDISHCTIKPFAAMNELIQTCITCIRTPNLSPTNASYKRACPIALGPGRGFLDYAIPCFLLRGVYASVSLSISVPE